MGDNKPTKVNVRIIAATNKDLKQEVEKGSFREDLFYRIAIFHIELPPLRERIIDIDELAFSFLFKLSQSKKKSISKEYLEILKQHQWKGNIRELRNVIERSLILCDGDELKVEHLPYELQQLSTSNPQFSTKRNLSAFELAAAEKIHIQKVLNYTNGNKTKTAELLNIALTTLYRKLNEYNIS